VLFGDNDRCGPPSGADGRSHLRLATAVTPHILSKVRSLLSSAGSPVAARWTFIATIAALLPIMIVSSFDFGVSWDEMDRHTYGVKVWEFVRGLRSRSSFAETGGHVYPGLFDTICAAVTSRVPGNLYELRHVVNAIFGWIGAVYCGRLAGRLFGPWSAVFAAVLLALSPRYFAASMNNPKDLPFAAMSVMALYYISTVSPRWPYVPPTTGIKIALSLALALNIRVGGLLYLGYFGLLIAVLVIAERQSHGRRLADTAMRVAVIALAVLLLGTLFWPWAGGAPLTRPFEALLGAAGYPWSGLILYDRYAYQAGELPWHYAPWWFVISTPPVVLAGTAFSLLFVSSRPDALRRIGLWAVAVFPVAAVIMTGATLYDSVRHLLFVYPVLVVLAVAGWSGMLDRSRPPWVRGAAAVAAAAGLVSIIVFDVRFHPNQGVYFNSVVGGPRRAFARYEMDYWGNCILQGVEWAAKAGRSFGSPVRISGAPAHIVRLDAERFPEVEFTDASDNRHHMYIDMARGEIRSFRNLLERPALYRVRTPDGAVLCTVAAGPAFAELGLRSPEAGQQAQPQ
jgi:hypothetical protein